MYLSQHSNFKRMSCSTTVILVLSCSSTALRHKGELELDVSGASLAANLSPSHAETLLKKDICAICILRSGGVLRLVIHSPTCVAAANVFMHYHLSCAPCRCMNMFVEKKSTLYNLTN